MPHQPSAATPRLPLARHPLLQTSDLDEYHAFVTATAGHHERRQLEAGRFQCHVNGALGGELGLCWVHYNRRMMLATSGDQRSWFVHLYRRGRGVYEFDDDMVVGDPGHAVVIRSGDPYQATLTSMDSYVVCLDGSFVGNEIARLGFPESSAPSLIPRRLDLRRRSGRMVRDLAVALRESMEAGSTSLLDHGPARRHLASAFVEAMLHRPGDPAPAHAAVTRPDDALDQLQQDIDRRLDDPLSLGDLCEVAGMGSRALQRACQARWGVSPMAYLAHCRLDRARALLRNARDGVTVAHVALSCGFVHLGRFSASYRDRFGELPSVTLAHAPRRRA